jgi:hypothetical protein
MNTGKNMYILCLVNAIEMVNYLEVQLNDNDSG